MPSPELPPQVYFQAPVDHGHNDHIQTAVESHHIIPLSEAIRVATSLARSKGKPTDEFFRGIEQFTKTLPVPEGAEALSVSDFAKAHDMDTETVGRKITAYQNYYKRNHTEPLKMPSNGTLSPKLQQILTLSDVFIGSRNPRLRRFSHLWWKDSNKFLDEYWSWVPLETLQEKKFQTQIGRMTKHSISELRTAAGLSARFHNIPLEIGVKLEPRSRSSRIATVSPRLLEHIETYLLQVKEEKKKSHRSAGEFVPFTLGQPRPERELSPLPTAEPRAPILSKSKLAHRRLDAAFKRSDEPLSVMKIAWRLRKEYLRTPRKNRAANFIVWLDENLKSKIKGYVEDTGYAAIVHYKLVRIENKLKKILF